MNQKKLFISKRQVSETYIGDPYSILPGEMEGPKKMKIDTHPEEAKVELLFPTSQDNPMGCSVQHSECRRKDSSGYSNNPNHQELSDLYKKDPFLGGFEEDKLECIERIEEEECQPESPQMEISCPEIPDDEEDEEIGSLFNYLVERALVYMPDAHYFGSKQSQINPRMRSILVDWMMEVSSEFKLKRETFHYSVNYLDRYLAAVPEVPKSELQLLGVTSLYMASKIEEIYPPKIRDFVYSTDNCYTQTQLRNKEKEIAQNLSWKLTPPTMNMWANWYMSQWDQREISLCKGEEYGIFFKLRNEKSYQRFRELMQLVDILTLDHEHLVYHPRTLVASALYLLLESYHGQVHCSYREIAQNNTSLPFYSSFSDFLFTSFGFELAEIIPTIEYIAPFMALPFQNNPPAVPHTDPDLLNHYEEFLSFQTYNRAQLNILRKIRSSQFIIW